MGIYTLYAVYKTARKDSTVEVWSLVVIEVKTWCKFARYTKP